MVVDINKVSIYLSIYLDTLASPLSLANFLQSLDIFFPSGVFLETQAMQAMVTLPFEPYYKATIRFLRITIGLRDDVSKRGKGQETAAEFTISHRKQGRIY